MEVRSIQRQVTLVCVIFVLMLSTVLGLVVYRLYTRTMFQKYERQMTSVLDYVESRLDKDDMSVCAETLVESEKYRQFQSFFDDFIDHYDDVHYLYIVRVYDAGGRTEAVEICAANSEYEKEFMPENVLHLGDWDPSWYDDETLARFLSIQTGVEDVFLLNGSKWGVDYSLFRPLIDSKGDHFGLLCVDVSMDELSASIYRNILLSVFAIFGIGLLFILLLNAWFRYHVIQPIQALEKSVSLFAQDSVDKRSVEELVYHSPSLKMNNEVSALASAVDKLANNMRAYLSGALAAEDEARNLQAHVFAMDALAYRDALTHVKNRAAYDIKKEELEQAISHHEAEFAIVMVDLNNLKSINDSYGHDYGNEYIVGSCSVICYIYNHSPVYRIGGDEFLVVLQGSDYRARSDLLRKLRAAFNRKLSAYGDQPWHNYSAAAGMAVFREGDSVESVFRRADEEMYRQKAAIKARHSRASGD